ncbi:MAG: hypothetical protein ACREDF_05825, partial [Thermoplasmata archaeon]
RAPRCRVRAVVPRAWGPFDVPCLRLQFRVEGERVVLERFTISDDGDERLVELDAAHDALQAWMDSMAG